MSEETGNVPVPRTESRGVIVLSRITSIIFHPLFMTAAMAVFLNSLAPSLFDRLSHKDFNRWISQLLVYTVVLPFLSILLFKITGLITSAKMHRPADRVLPLIATMFFYVLTYVILVIGYGMAPFVQGLILGSSCAIFIILIINFFYKVSVHTTAAAILPGMCIVLIMAGRVTTILPLLFAIMVAIIVGAIRWFLGSHTIGQILLGYIVGVFSQVGAYLIVNI